MDSRTLLGSYLAGFQGQTCSHLCFLQCFAYIYGGLEQPNANWESPLDRAGSTGSAAGNGEKSISGCWDSAGS